MFGLILVPNVIAFGPTAEVLRLIQFPDKICVLLLGQSEIFLVFLLRPFRVLGSFVVQFCEFGRLLVKVLIESMDRVVVLEFLTVFDLFMIEPVVLLCPFFPGSRGKHALGLDPWLEPFRELYLLLFTSLPLFRLVDCGWLGVSRVKVYGSIEYLLQNFLLFLLIFHITLSLLFYRWLRKH